MFEVSVVSIDYYMLWTKTRLEFIEATDGPVPVVRVFGSTPLGQRTCVHIHGAFPYLYFCPENPNSTTFSSEEEVKCYLPAFERKINELLDVWKPANSNDLNSGLQRRKRRHVQQIEVVSRRSMYAFHKERAPFVKVSLRNPSEIPRLALLLEEGALGEVMQPYESHLPFLLKITHDYAIPPMGFMKLGPGLRFRSPLPPDQPLFPPPRLVSDKSSICDEGVEEEERSTLFTQSNVNLDLLWPSSAESNQPTEPISVEGEKAHLETNHVPESQLSGLISDLLEGLTSQDMLWTQFERLKQETCDNEIDDVEVKLEMSLEKLSTCELEVDVHVSHIVKLIDLNEDCESATVGQGENIYVVDSFKPTYTLRPNRFGAELWEEESKRRRLEGLPPEEPMLPPSTQSCHRQLEEIEREYAFRLGKLISKGEALKIRDEKSQMSELNERRCESTEANVHGSAMSSAGLKSPTIQLSQLKNSEESPLLDMISQAVFSQGDFFSPLEVFAPGQMPMDQQVEESVGQWISQQAQESSKSVDSRSRLLSHEVDERFSPNDSVLYSEFSYDPDIKDPEEGEEEEDFTEGAENAAGSEAEDILKCTQGEDFHDIITLQRAEDKQSEGTVGTKRKSVQPAWTGALESSNLCESTDVHAPMAESQIPVRNITLASAFKKKKPNSTMKMIDSKENREDAVKTRSFSVRFQLPNQTVESPSDVTIPPEPPEPEMSVLLQSPSPQRIVDDKLHSPEDLSFLSPNVVRRGLFEGVSPGSVTPVLFNVQQFQKNTARSHEMELSRSLSMTSCSSDDTVHSGTSVEEDPIITNDVVESISRSNSALCIRLRSRRPPSRKKLMSLESFNLPKVLNPPLVYSAPQDVAFSRKPRAIGGRLVSINMDSDAEDFPSTNFGQRMGTVASFQDLLSANRTLGRFYLLPTRNPPAASRLRLEFSSLDGSGRYLGKQQGAKSQIASPTLTSSIKLDMNIGNANDTKQPEVVARSVAGLVNSKLQRLVTFSVEIFCSGRVVDKVPLLPNPKFDPVQCVCWTIDDVLMDSDREIRNQHTGLICVVQKPPPGMLSVEQLQQEEANEKLLFEKRSRQQLKQLVAAGLPKNCEVLLAASELELLGLLALKIRFVDPDFLVGYEIQRTSIGYLIERGHLLSINLLKEFSRVPGEKPPRRNENDEYSENHESGIFMTGRITLNLWRSMRDELKLFSYTRNNVAAHLLNKQIPLFSNDQLTRWFRNPLTRHRTVRYTLSLATLNLTLMDRLDLIRRTSESARLYGIDFFSVLSRGSQYRVESSLLRSTGPMGYVAMSPSRKKVAGQAPMAVIPLVMEPQCGFYKDPVVVLDFQALYPSMMIAYNLCFTTIMGKLLPGKAGTVDTTGHLGASEYPERATAAAIYDHIRNSREIRTTQSSGETADEFSTIDLPFVAPNGSVFCRKHVRAGILPRMLKDILETRLMVKRAMKRYSNERSSAKQVLKRVLDARQLSIKLLANVTYGYTSAGFSGRMPMAELADAIVQSGRSTLEWAMGIINASDTWKAEVVYGDTDSLFVHLPGRSKEEAFAIGKEIADHITKLSPPDVVLKFEKVYYPCILVTKKRYVGASFESSDQIEPHFDAKGIESVRRDQCPLVVKLQEKSLRLLFSTRNLSTVKEYLCRQWGKILMGTDIVSVRDFIFCKDVKIGHYRALPPPGAEVALKAMMRDPMKEPPYRWRVPYVIVCGTAASRLMDLAVDPYELMQRGSTLRINSFYYITKCINPALERVLGLSGADIKGWYDTMKKRQARVRNICYEDYAVEAPTDELQQQTWLRTRGQNQRQWRQQSMDAFTMRGSCECCGVDSVGGLCRSCKDVLPEQTTILLQDRLNREMDAERVFVLDCRNCSGYTLRSELFRKGQLVGRDCCESLDCPTFFDRCRNVISQESYIDAMKELKI